MPSAAKCENKSLPAKENIAHRPGHSTSQWNLNSRASRDTMALDAHSRLPMTNSPPPKRRGRCHSGYVGARCEHADLLAVVAASQKKQAITALVVVSIVALAVLIIACVLIHCCQVRKHCEWCRTLVCQHEKPSALLKGRTACCHSETGKGLFGGPREAHPGGKK
ncbi:Protransforming growth factor alpha [Sciurus carolinensis]|uniref:Protransforming growth factor alpha n=1 Tax=Sciurus carolinensis TaxID=30640 RepID=A0AA41MRC6_SCICA|nr:Protransforming growth factor alpha [Sciurus carolinensis]